MYPLDINQLINNSYPNIYDIVCIPVFRKTECLHAICALGNDFENRGGGYILIGVKNNFSEGSFAVTGLKDFVGEDLISEIFELTNFILPKISVIPELITFEDKQILILKVKSTHRGPYRARESLSGSSTQSPPFFFYIKKGLKIYKASALELETLIIACSLQPFDERELKNSEECMLSLHLIHEFLIKNDRVTYTEINQLNLLETLKYLNLLAPKSMQHYPLNAAGLLFSYHPEKLFRATYTDVIIKKSSDPTKSTRTRFTGPLFR
ncbi:MAG: helix-turn-helix domain-containing protein, partial [Succinivibrio sp.]